LFFFALLHGLSELCQERDKVLPGLEKVIGYAGPVIRGLGERFAERLPASLLFTGSRYRQLDDPGAKFRFIE
jgi:hypothetical protein